MIEMAFGILVALAAALLASGALDAWVALPGFGAGSFLALVAVGAALVAHGGYRRVRNRRDGPQYWLRTKGLALAAAAATIVLGAVLPAAFAPLGLFKIGGFPLGYYAAAQLLPILLVILLFWFTRTQDGVCQDEQPGQQPPS